MPFGGADCDPVETIENIEPEFGGASRDRTIEEC